MSRSELEKEVFAMPPADRARLADQMLASLESPGQQEIDRAWAAEAEDRIAAFDRGQIDALPADEVHQQIEQHLRS